MLILNQMSACHLTTYENPTLVLRAIQLLHWDQVKIQHLLHAGLFKSIQVIIEGLQI